MGLGDSIDKIILEKIYNNKYYLEYLRNNPKWYYYLDEEPNNFKVFEENVKKEYKITMPDKLEKVKERINFISTLINYFQNN